MYDDDYLDTADMWRMEQEAREADRIMYGYYEVDRLMDDYYEDDEDEED